jgi:hypothetical protein
MKHSIAWLKEQITFHLEMTYGELLTIGIYLAAVIAIIIICITHI